jgi:hypothetical protein
MGSSSKSVTIGYKYYLGMHMALCHGVIDAVLRIRADKRNAWLGEVSSGSLNISAPNLFGGESREGGLSGKVDVLNGSLSQGVNSYLNGRLASPVPAFRGVASLVANRVYIGTNPYLKNWGIVVRRIDKTSEGLEQWYKAKSQIGYLYGNHAIYIALDNSGSMDTIVSGSSTRLDNAKSSINGLLNFLKTFVKYSTIDIILVAWAGTESSSITKRAVTSSDIEAIKSFLNAMSGNGTETDFDYAVADVADFFNGASNDATRTVLFITDGEPNPTGSATTASTTLFSTSGITSYGFNIDLTDTTYTALMDNSSSDGVPVISSSDADELQTALYGVLPFPQIDMNPAHIIRECLTDKTWGLGYDTSDIDDTSFTACANTLYDEQFGLSLLWSQESSLYDFISLILSHIEGTLYVSRETGKFTLHLARADYDIDDLLTLDDTNISNIENFKRKSTFELANQVSVTFEDCKTSENNSVTVHNLALIQQQGNVIAESFEFVGISNQPLAEKVANRELQTLSSPLISCTIYANREAYDLNVGEVFKLSTDRYGLSNVVMRVASVEFGNLTNNSIKLECVQDVFGVQNTIYASTDSEWESPLSDPTDVTVYRMFEVPYWDLVQIAGEANAEALDPLFGYVGIAIVRPNDGQYSGKIYNVIGGVYTEAETIDFCPTALLNGVMSITATTIPIDNADNVESVRIGSYCLIDDEIMRVDAVSDTSITVGRGCLDTVRVAHADNARVYFLDDYIGTDGVEYADGETVSYKIVTLAGNGELSIDLATVRTATLNQRAYRAYPPAKLELNSISYPTSITGVEDLVVTWAHRNRIQQTAGTIIDDLEYSITPESGTTYTIELRTSGGTLISSQTGITGTTHTFTVATMGANYGDLRLLLWSVRDSLDSFQKHDYTFNRIAP